MNTLKELIHYCSERDPIGALMFTGEWGSGKTYIIENELAKALHDTHILVRISLFGVDSINSLRDTVKHQWFQTCSPFFGKIQEEKDRLRNDKGLFTVLRSLLRAVNPFSANLADAMVAMNPLDFIPIEPEIEDLHAHQKKRVILIFDDLERSRLNQIDLLGVINEYCENQHFNTIVVVNEESLILQMQTTTEMYEALKEKIVAFTVLNTPDYPKIVRNIIENRTWPDQTYKDFLSDNEQLILDAFRSKSPAVEKQTETYGKFHNIRSLIGSLQSFYRIYFHMKEAGIPEIAPYLYSFLAYTLVKKGGFLRNGSFCSSFTDDDVKHLYPLFSGETLPDSVRQWITFGYWDEDRFLQEISAIAPQTPETKSPETQEQKAQEQKTQAPETPGQ